MKLQGAENRASAPGAAGSFPGHIPWLGPQDRARPSLPPRAWKLTC